MDFPELPGAVDAAWLTEVFRQAGRLEPGQRVAEFALEPIGGGFGQTGDAARITLRYEPGAPGAAPASAFIKFATTDPRRRAASQRLGLYRREVDFYRRLVGHTKVRAPLCYFAGVSPAGDYATLVLEDFPDHRPGDDLLGLRPHEAERVVDLLVDLHAPFWGGVDKLGLEPLVMGSRAQFEPAWQEMEDRFGDQLAEPVRREGERFLNAIDGLQAWLLSAPATLGHGDLKLDNLLFGPSEEDPIVAVDWQAVRPQRGIRDFGYAISHSMDVEDRRASERALLQRYLDGLARHGIDYPLAEAEQDYRIAMLFDFLTVIYITGVNINTNERANRRKRKLLERTTTALLDWDALPLLGRFG